MTASPTCSIHVARLDIPPLRERPQDILLLAVHFLARYGDPGDTLSPAALAALECYSWPGNVRELESAIRSATVMSSASPIDLESFPPAVRGLTQVVTHGEARSLPTTNLKELERIALEHALAACHGNRAKAAQQLGISRSSVFNKIKEYGIGNART